MKNSIYLLIAIMLFINFSSITYGNEDMNIEHNEVEIKTDEQNVITDNNENSKVSNEELVSIILQMKDDKLILLNNIINWILAGLAIIVTLLIVVFTILFNSLRKKEKEVRKLTDKLKIKEEEINKIHEEIQDIMTSQEYKKRVNDLESTLSELEEKIEKTQEAISILTALTL